MIGKMLVVIFMISMALVPICANPAQEHLEMGDTYLEQGNLEEAEAADYRR